MICMCDVSSIIALLGVYNAFLHRLFTSLKSPLELVPDHMEVEIPQSELITTLDWKLPYWETWSTAGRIKYGDIQIGKYHDDVAIDRLKRILHILSQKLLNKETAREKSQHWLTRVRSSFRNAEYVVAREGRRLLRLATGGEGSSINIQDSEQPFTPIGSEGSVWESVSAESIKLLESLINWDRRFSTGRRQSSSSKRLSYMNQLWHLASDGSNKTGTHPITIDYYKLKSLGDTGVRKWGNSADSDNEVLDYNEVSTEHH
jgi:hypothetical protein